LADGSLRGSSAAASSRSTNQSGMPVAAATIAQRFKNERREMLNRCGRAEFEEGLEESGNFEDMR
jgi:hypothetical protein